ncbi:hypothetical protein ACFE04_001975 [Oxalis oulophora]
MSRPTTRGKNKRHRQVNDVDLKSEILRRIHSTGDITDDDVKKLYKITKPICQGCRVNTKDNPNCFCGLIPPPNGSRKTGLWQKTSEIVQDLGPDPSKDLRASEDSPAGLTNLGATCYANSILQCLYMNKSFRDGVFSVEADVLKEQPVLDQLVRLFAQLHVSKMAIIDSAPFIKTLELDNGVQQDSHEFLTLLLSLLERCLSHSKIPKAKTVIQDLFRGNVSHVTRCLKCGRDSEASAKMEDFYELELNVKGLKNLGDSLDDYLSVEELCGDNQYYCESCKTRVDATRSIKLRSLPEVLNFQLKRCVFLPKTTMRKKITSAFSFPGVLNMQRRLSDPSHLELTYDLKAVLIHKGTAVNSGHYIAHIKDDNTGQWWEFDDEQVSNLGNHPFGEGSSNSTKRSEPQEATKEANADGNHLDSKRPQLCESSKANGVECFSSNDAYMLMYYFRHGKKDDEKRHGFGGTQNSNNNNTETNIKLSCDGIALPSFISEEIESLNASYESACEDFKNRKEKELGCITERRQEVRSILSEAPVLSLEEPFYWISTDWLRQWADSISEHAIDNTPILCSHGKVSVSKVSCMKRLSATAWTTLFSKYAGGPTLSNADYCLDCLVDGAQSLVSADSYRDRRLLMRTLATDVLLGKCSDGTFYVSKSWLQQWVKRKNLDTPTEADAGPTASIRCPHGKLMPERAAGAKRLLVSENLWGFIYEDAITVKPDDPLGSSPFPIESEQCLECIDELSEVASLEDTMRAVKLQQRQNHEKLASGKNILLAVHSKYYLIPSSWIAKWKAYVNASGKNISSCEEPEPLGSIINSLICDTHTQLLEKPPELVWKRGSIVQKSSVADGLTIVTENDWKCFCSEWDVVEEKGISAMIEFSHSEGNNNTESSEDKPVPIEHLDNGDEANGDNESRLLVIRTLPQICEVCIGERKSCELMQKLTYSNEDIYVYLVRGKEAPKSILEASESTTFEPDRRMSKRSRRTNNGNLITLKVSATTSIYQLKMMIWESLGVVKENQLLFKGSRTIEEETFTLADMNIFPKDLLLVRDSEIHEHRDIADEISEQKTDVQNTEEGFRGTLLTANIPS